MAILNNIGQGITKNQLSDDQEQAGGTEEGQEQGGEMISPNLQEASGRKK